MTINGKKNNRGPHFAEETHGTITSLFERYLGTTSRLAQWEHRIGLMPLNGRPINEHRARLRKPGRPTVHKQYHEGEVAAALLLSLGYTHEDVRDIEMSDKPDLKIRFRDLDVHAEVTRVCHDEDEQLDNAIIEANYTLKKMAISNADFAAELKTFLPSIKICSRSGYPIPEQILVSEIKEWISKHALIDHRSGCRVTDFDDKWPTLASLGAKYSCTNSAYPQGRNFIHRCLPSLDLQSLIRRIENCIEDKRSKKYPQRPLWLLMSISESWSNRLPGDGDAITEFFETMKHSPIKVNTSDFDKVIIGVNGYAITL